MYVNGIFAQNMSKYHIFPICDALAQKVLITPKGVTMHRCIDASRYLGRRYVYRIVTQVSRY